MVPHFSEELWERAGGRESVFRQPWPSYDEKAATEDVVTIAVQVNGKVRGEVAAERGASKDTVLDLARAEERVQRHIAGKAVQKTIFVQDRLINIVAT
jgi:leucyl-tRNA synthetase